LLCFLGVAGPASVQPGDERYGLWIVAPGVLLIVLAYTSWSRGSRAVRHGIALLAAVQISLLLAGYWQYYQRRFDVPAAEQRLAHWTYRADNYAAWLELRQEFERSLNTQNDHARKVIFIEANDPQRWWFEWKWRYLSYGSEYEWRIISNADEALTISDASEQRWILRSQQESEKENLSIRYLAN